MRWHPAAVACLLPLLFSASASADCRTVYRPAYSYHAPAYAHSAYSAPVVVKKAVNYGHASYGVVHKKVDDYHFLKYVAVVPLVELPTYGAAYVPYAPVQHGAQPTPAVPSSAGAQAPVTAPKSTDELRQVLEALRGLDGRLKALEGRGPTVGQPAPAVDPAAAPAGAAPAQPQLPDVKAVNKAKCALCHERGSEAQGGGFVLSEKDGSIARLTDKQLADLDEQVYQNKMPKLNAKAKAAGIVALTDLEYNAFRQEITRQRALNKNKEE